MAQWIRRETTNLKIAGSNPVGDKFILSLWRNWITHPSPKGKIAGSNPARDEPIRVEWPA